MTLALNRLDRLAGFTAALPTYATGWGTELEAYTHEGDAAVSSFGVSLRPELNHFTEEGATQALSIVALIVLASARCNGILEPMPGLPAPPVEVVWLDANGGKPRPLRRGAPRPVAIVAQLPGLKASATFIGEPRLWPALAAAMAEQQAQGNCPPVIGNDGGRYRLLVAAPGQGVA